MDVIRQIKEDVRRKFVNLNGSHGWDHLTRVYNLCMHIGKKEKADLEVLKLAAILHDIGRAEQDKSKGKSCHAKRGVILVRQVLEKYEVDEKVIDQVVHCVESHRFRVKQKPKSKEAKVLFDADKLDSIGAIGIGRAFLFAGEIGAELHNDEHVHIEKTKPYTNDDTAYREFMFKLRRIKDRMLTEKGKRIAEERHHFMVGFFDRLKKEIRGKL